MKLDKIILELKKILKEDDMLALGELVKKLEVQYKQENYAKNPTDKQKLATIKKVLKNKIRPILEGYTPLKNGTVAFTDSYQLYITEDTILPFKVAFGSDWSEEEQEDFIKNHDIQKEDVYSGVYPNVKACIPDVSNIEEYITLNTNDIINDSKVTEKVNGKKIYDINEGNVSVTIDIDFLVNLIKILKLSGDFTLEYYGRLRPLVVRKDKELGLILPIAKY